MKIGIPKDGRFGDFGGKYIPETLAPAIEELEKNYLKIRNDPIFKKELNKFLAEYAGRPTPLYLAKNLTKKIGGAKIYLKREDLLHGGAHKINNTLGQALLAKRMGKKRINKLWKTYPSLESIKQAKVSEISSKTGFPNKICIEIKALCN